MFSAISKLNDIWAVVMVISKCVISENEFLHNRDPLKSNGYTYCWDLNV